jgi:hypothetical protein
MPNCFTTNLSWRPPLTIEVQLDEKWCFVWKKRGSCDPNDPADLGFGDRWDHVAIDAERGLVLVLIIGERTAERSLALVEEVRARTYWRLDLLVTSDEHAPYKKAIHEVYGLPTLTQKPNRSGRPTKPRKVVPATMCYATVRKTRRKGRVTKVVRKLVFGCPHVLAQHLERSSVSTTVNTSFVERHNGTDRGMNARKRRKTYCFSKSVRLHDAVSYFVAYSYNFCWPVRTLASRYATPGPCTPAMAAGLTDHVWSMREWLTYPAACA